jgi:hypothetical protein
MTFLLIHVPDRDERVSFETKFGGRPSAPPESLVWPVCKACKGNMQFLGQIQASTQKSRPTELLLLFMCQNKPGLCEEWDANGGGNKVVPVPTDDLALLQPPPSGETTRATRYGAIVVEQPDTDYETARNRWTSIRPGEVLGQLAGSPAWIQFDQVPTCDSCAKPMYFVAQLEQGPDRKTEMNFGGGGCAYIFRCTCSSKSAKMLWQC